MSSPTSVKMGNLPALKRQHLLAEFAGLKQACPRGIYVSLTPGDPSLWTGVLFVRDGPYASAVLRFHMSFPDAYPARPPLVTFSTDLFHPLITPLSTYMYSTDVADGAEASAHDEERLPPGGFSLRHGFPGWFGRGRARARAARVGVGDGDGGSPPPPPLPARREGDEADVVRTPTRAVATATGMTPGSGASGSTASASVSASASASVSASVSAAGHVRPAGWTGDVSTYEVLRYMRSVFDDEDVLDSVPLEAAGNPGAWHAWRTHRRQRQQQQQQQAVGTASQQPARQQGVGSGSAAGPEASPAARASGDGSATTRQPGEWNWEGVWEERVKRGITASLSEGVLFGNAGATDEVITFLSMDEAEVEGAKSNLLRTLGASA